MAESCPTDMLLAKCAFKQYLSMINIELFLYYPQHNSVFIIRDIIML